MDKLDSTVARDLEVPRLDWKLVMRCSLSLTLEIIHIYPTCMYQKEMAFLESQLFQPIRAFWKLLS